MLLSRSHRWFFRQQTKVKPVAYVMQYSSTTYDDNMSKSTKKKVVIVGGVAGGATAAARLSRLTNNLDITIFEKSPDVSFANCGLPYYIGREITDRSRLALQTPASLAKSLGITVKTQTEVLAIDRLHKTIRVKDLLDQQESTVPYDHMILSPGASPIRPPVAGIAHPRICSLRNLQDMDRIDALVASPTCQEVIVIGAGFIGLEMVEQLHRAGKRVHLVEKASQVLPQADPEMAAFLQTTLHEQGVQLHLGDGLQDFPSAPKNAIQVRLTSGRMLTGDLVILSIGVTPASELATAAQLQTNPQGFIQVNEYMQTNDPAIYAVGDVIETKDLVFPERRLSVALGNLANMQARIAADHLVTGQQSIPYRGSLGTAIVRCFDTVLGVTGWTEKRLRLAAIPYATTTVTGWDHASYYPGAVPMTLKLVFDPATGRIYGAQAVGSHGVDKRIDVIATAITGRLTIDDLSLTQFTYAPPFGSARDVVNTAALAARNIKDGWVTPAYHWPGEEKTTDTTSNGNSNNNPVKVQLVDVRPRDNALLRPLPQAINLPYEELRSMDISTILDPTIDYRTVCSWGKTAYFASRILKNAGFQSSTLIGGLTVHQKLLPEPPTTALNVTETSSPSATAAAPVVPVTTVVSIDCKGMSCPGPLLKLKQSILNLPEHARLEITATDPGFKADVKAFAQSHQLHVIAVTTEKGVIHAILEKGIPRNPHGSTTTTTTTTSTLTTSNISNIVRKGATIVVFSEELDKVLAALVIANGAAAMGGEVTMFFTFWGLHALRTAQGQAPANHHKSAMDHMFGAMMPKGPNHLPLSHMNFGGIGAELMKYVMHQKHLPNIPELLASARAQKIRFVACTMSMEAIGITKEELVEGVELGGVADYLAASEKAGTNLFI